MSSAKSAGFLPKAFRWVFTIFEVCTVVAVVAILGVMLVNPSLPPDAHFTHKGDILGQAAEFSLTPAPGGQGEPVFRAKAFNGTLTVVVERTGGMIEMLKRYGLPILLIKALFLTVLFDLLRRLFRNVGRGESFTTQSVRLVQGIGASLIVFWLASNIAEGWFAYAAWDYFSQHTQIAVSGTPLKLPPTGEHGWFSQIRLFDWVLFSGLLVLALAEVFRQGLALRRDADLTV